MANFRLDSIFTWGIIGTTVGAALYLYKGGHLKDFNLKLPDIFDDGDDTPEPQQPEPTPGSGAYTYWAKRKMQCRDNHLTLNYLTGIGVKAVNWKLYNDGRVFPAVCGAPSSFTILVALDAQDPTSGAKLAQLGFIQYFAAPTDNPSTQIPAPTLANVAMSMSYVGVSPGHKAYTVKTHVSQ